MRRVGIRAAVSIINVFPPLPVTGRDSGGGGQRYTKAGVLRLAVDGS